MSAYLAVGVWHHWLVRRDHAFVRRMWPVVRRGLDFAVSLQLPWGGIAWSQEWHDGAPGRVNEEALLAALVEHPPRAAGGAGDRGAASTTRSRSGSWRAAGWRTPSAHHEDRFLDKAHFSMDWYYPVLGGRA